MNGFPAQVRDELFLASAVGAYGAGQERSNEKGFLKVVRLLSGTDRSSEYLSLVPCSGEIITLGRTMQTYIMSKLWGKCHEAIKRTPLESKGTKCSG